MSAFLALQRLSISRRLGILIFGAVIGILLLTADFPDLRKRTDSAGKAG